jgi:predicted transcriptional regulator
METKQYISVEVLSAKTKLPQKYLKELAKKNVIPALNVNGRLRFNPEAVQQALDKLAAKGGRNGQ